MHYLENVKFGTWKKTLQQLVHIEEKPSTLLKEYILQKIILTSTVISNITLPECIQYLIPNIHSCYLKLNNLIYYV